MIFASAVLTELCPRIVDHRAHHLFDETLPRTAYVFDRSTRATGQPPAAARFVLIRELHPLGTEMTRALSTANCHAAMEMTHGRTSGLCADGSTYGFAFGRGQQARGGNCITCDKLVRFLNKL
ncbi:hypothetical protein ZEAMMB73_Zm00001d032221 [Zea mays]|uniref:Uncharacterized protein n=1 Tax=Zea mays TaxID=4577 RepID=A0A1D6KPA8_MAIZE|nr:hypothetical protein ZEAMMB73_Zm00001d032221 [Zea mays]